MCRLKSLLPLLAVAIAGTAPRAAAAPRDEVLRVAPPDAAIVVVVQDAREHVHAVMRSPFVEWFPRSDLGKTLLAEFDPRQLRESTAPIFAALGVTPTEVLDDVLGDAAVFAYAPAPPGDPKGERAVILVRPRKPETLARLVDRVNEIQTADGEIKAVVRREHRGEPYFERQKATGESEFYCTRGGVFAYSGNESDITSVIDRDRAAAGGKPSRFAASLTKLGVADAAAVVLVNPRALDAEVKAKVAAARPDEKPFLDRFAEVWAALDAAAVYLAVGADVEAGVALDFRPGALSPAARGWLTGTRAPSGLWAAVPDTALFAAAARFRAGELIATVRSLLPEKGKQELDKALGDTLGSVVGRSRLPRVLDALGPDWVVWVEPPAGEGAFLPVVVGAVQIDADGPTAGETRRAIERAVGFGFQAAQVAYNATHADQIELQETDDGGVVITTLVNEKAFPPGFRPSYAFKGGYLVVASSPEPVRRFRVPATPPAAAEAVAVRFSGAATRAYLQAHRAELAKFLSEAGHGEEADLLGHIDRFAAVLEPVERVELVTRGTDTGVRLAVRLTLTKPLK